MSLESAKLFLEIMKTDRDFRDRFESATKKEDRLKLLEAKGFYFKEAELQAVMNPSGDELDDDDLDGVTGGVAGTDPHAWSPTGGKTSCGW